MKKLLLIILAFFTFSFSYSQEWKLIDTRENGEKVYIRPNSRNTAWIKEQSSESQMEFDKLDSFANVHNYTLKLFKFDCNSRKIGLINYYKYNTDGEVYKSEENIEVLVDMVYVIPDSVGEFFLKKHCKLDALIDGIGKSDGTDTGIEGDDNQAGDPYAPSYFGDPGSGGGGVDYGLKGRGRPTKSKVIPECDEEGSVVVEIHVNREGRVTNAVPGKRGTTGNICLYDAAKKTALSYKWPSDSKAPTRQVGFVVINFM